MGTHRSFRLSAGGAHPTVSAGRSMLHVAIIQAAILLVTSIILDGGVLFCISYVAAAGYWVGVGIILLRRGRSLRRDDRQFVQVGYFITLVLSLFFAIVVSALR